MGGERISGLDGAFLALESETTHLHVTGVLVLDPMDVSPDVVFRRIRARIAERMDLVRPFRMRVESAPLGLDHPRLIEVPRVDLDYHLRRAGLPHPGGRRELEAFAADAASRPLDRRRPLWEMHVVEGLAGGGVAVVAKVHHAVIDGVAGAELLATFLDLDPDPRAAAVTPIDHARRPRGAGPVGTFAADEVRGAADRLGGESDALPGGTSLAELEPWLQLLGSLPGRLDDTVRIVGRTAQRLRSLAPDRHRAVTPEPLPFSAPRTSINRAISPHRRAAFGDLGMPAMNRVREVLGGTLNDVVLAVVAGSLRSFFASRSELPDRPLVAMVPVSVRTPTQRGTLGNQLSAVLVELPVDVADPVERLARVRASAAAAKRLDAADRSQLARNWADVVLPGVTARAARVATDRRLFDRMRPIFNLVVSNVPGPPVPLYLAGMRLRGMYPLGPITEGSAVNITVVSYVDTVKVGVLACWELVPDVDVIACGLEDALAELVRAADRRDRPVPWWHAEVQPA